MKSVLAWSVPLALLALSTSCSDDSHQPSNGVPSPQAGAVGVGAGGKAGDDGSSGKSGGSSGASTIAAGAGGEGGAEPLEPEGGAAGEAGAGGAPSVPFDGTCATLPGTVLYIESGDTQENLLKNLGRHLRDTANITLAFNLTGSCTLTDDMYKNTKVVKSGMLKYIPSTAEDSAWTTAMPEPTCTTGPQGVSLDLAISALFVDSCGLGETPANLAQIQGPIQAYTFIVPSASEQTAIWAEEAYYAFGFGAANPLAPTYNPWNNESFLFIRPTTKSTLVATAKNIAVPPNKWKGVQEPASTDVVTAVAGSAQPKATLGILGAEVYDSNRNKGIQTLAFQAFEQSAAFYPDSTASAFDKQNVRDGHYTLWSPTVYIAPVNSAKVISNPATKYLVELVLGDPAATPPQGGSSFDSLADVVKVGLIPECAMQVSRAVDGGELSPFVPDESCICYYLSKVPGASGTPAGCTPCTSKAQCGAGSCNHGFCEPNTVSSADTGVPGCFSGNPTTHEQLINACTSAQAVIKPVVVPSPTVPLP
ncbi:MAG TPA: hypothetical protein VER11_25670 [Polyangiaceae bacterium]|nr:hypothetical protein [Polyangiaceae bacterium]